MRRLLRRLAAMLALPACLTGPTVYAAEWPLADMNRTIEQTNFLVNKGCSGTLIDRKNRYVLTANHCVTDQYETIERETIGDDGVIKKDKVRRLRDGTVTQLRYEGTESVVSVAYKVRVAAVSADRDLALLQIRAPISQTIAARLACAPPIRGERVYIVGNPMGVLYSSVTRGIVSSVLRDYQTLRFGESEQAKQPLMQISGGVIGGNSGGAAYNDRGELIGVPIIADTARETLGFAVPIDAIRAFLGEHDAAHLFAHCVVGK